MHATDALKDWMFSHVYNLESVDETPRARVVILALFDKFMEQPELMQGDYADLCDVQDGSTPALARCVCDYIAGMTDRFAAESFARFFMPSSWRGV